jgi:endonuclease/exonuclease/phosphatase family metal-dependent hydrolase
VLTETHNDLDLGPTHSSFHSTERDGGGRWTSVWSPLRVLEPIETADPSRCVAMHLDGGSEGTFIVYGTVLPWQHDPGPDPERPAKAWAEFPRITAAQGEEWRALRERHPDATLIVAGDLNHSLGGPHFSGTTAGRALLRSTLGQADLVCLTETENFTPGTLESPPIDHICAVRPVSARRCSPRRWSPP